jgi:hypothetical protein
LHHQMRSVGESASIFAEFAERHHSVPFCAALPLTIGVLPTLFGRNRKRSDDCAA